MQAKINTAARSKPKRRFALAVAGLLCATSVWFAGQLADSAGAYGNENQTAAIATAAGRLDLVASSVASEPWPQDIGTLPQKTNAAAIPHGKRLTLLAPGATTTELSVALPAPFHSIKTEDGAIAIVAPAERTGSTFDGADDQVKSGASQVPSILGDGSGGLPSVGIEPNERIIAMLSAPIATDSQGNRKSVSVETSGAQIRFSGENGEEPDQINLIAMPTGQTGTGWISYGVDETFPSSTFSIETGEAKAGEGCVFIDEGTMGRHEVSHSRQVAFSPGKCQSLVETERVASTAATSSGIVLLNNGVRRRAHHANWQEDPVGINVNFIRDWVTWSWNGSCVTAIWGAGHHTEVYEPTGWAKDVHNAWNTQDCNAATKQSYVKFSGGQYFPACFGSKVTTYYNTNIVQGYKNGTAGFYVSKVTGGAPCYTLLHWESAHGNIVVG